MEIDRLFHRRHCAMPRGGEGGPPRRPSSYHNGRDAPRAPDRRGISLQRTWDGSMMTTTDSKAHTEENRQTSSLKANGVPMKMLLKAEMSKEGKPRQNAPGLIARLMGLDTLPASGPVYKSGAYSQKSLKGHSCGFNAKQPECKDVFEVVERSQTDKHKIPPPNGTLQRSRSSDSKEDLRQNFVSTRCQFAREQVKDFRDIGDVSESLDSNEDFFLRFLQEPHPLLAKHFFDLDSILSSPEPTPITVLKSSKPTKLNGGELSLESIKKCENCTRSRRNATCCKEKCDSVFHNHSSTDQCNNATPKLGKKIGKKSDCSSLPTRIVVLKPSLAKAPSGSDSFPFQCSMKSSISGHRRHKSSGSCTFSSENREHQHFSFKIDVPRSKLQNSDEAPIYMEKTRKKCKSKDYFEGVSNFGEAESICRRRSKSSSADKVASNSHSGDLGELENRHLAFSSHPTESFVNREARRHLSKQLSMSNSCEDVGYRGQGPSTLAEMLALSDGETSASNPLDSQPVEDYPLGISSRDGWKDIWPRKLSRSRSLPASSTFLADLNSSHHEEPYENGECHLPKDVFNVPVSCSAEEPELHRKLQDSSPGNENVLPSKILLDDCREEKNTPPPCSIVATSDEDNASKNAISLSEPLVSFYDAVASAEDTLASSDTNRTSTTVFANDELLQDAITSESRRDTSSDNNDGIVLSKIKMPDVIEADSFSEPAISKVELLQAPKDAEQPSPVSVLDPLDEEDQSRPGCFQRVNAELQSLRLQLQLLRSESVSTCTEGSEIPSDEEINGSCDEPEGRPKIPQFSTYEDDRDFSYVLGILRDSALQGAVMDEIRDACHLPETPIDLVVFVKHEKFYKSSSWQRGERKLLFDLVNSILSEKLAPKIGLGSWMQHRRAFGVVSDQKLDAEDIWRSLVKRRLESTCNLGESFLDVGWLDVANDVGTIGRDVERMIRDELLEEIVSEFIPKKI